MRAPKATATRCNKSGPRKLTRARSLLVALALLPLAAAALAQTAGTLKWKYEVDYLQGGIWNSSPASWPHMAAARATSAASSALTPINSAAGLESRSRTA